MQTETPARKSSSTPVALELDTLKAGASRRHGWQARNSFYYQDLQRFFSFHVEKNARVLEIGFGVGAMLDACSASKGVGLDLSETACTEARKLFPKHSFYAWDGSAALPQALLDSAPEGFDYILLPNAPGFWPDIQKSLTLLKPLCKPHTRVLATYYNFLWAPVFKLAEKLRLKMPQPSLNWLSADDVAGLFKISGYRVLKKGYRCLLPRNIWPLGPLINRFLTPLPFFNWMGCTHFVIARPPATVWRDDLTVSVVMPARNEKGNIESAVRRMAEVARTRRERYEFIIVEGNSTDDTWAEIKRVVGDASIPKPGPIVICQQPGKGKGDAVRVGFAKATGDLLMILDADLTVPPEDLPKFVDVYCDGHGEFINGCRLVYKMEKEAMRPINLMGNKFFSWAFTWLLDQRFKDTLCGTKVLSRRNYERIVEGRGYFGNFDPFGDFDLIFGASKLDLEIAEVPIRYKERSYGETNISRWKHGWLLLKMCVYALGKIKFVP